MVIVSNGGDCQSSFSYGKLEQDQRILQVKISGFPVFDLVLQDVIFRYVRTQQ